jgi:3-dehydroquinate synthase
MDFRVLEAALQAVAELHKRFIIQLWYYHEACRYFQKGIVCMKYIQSFTVPFSYPVIFTRAMFSKRNNDLSSVFSESFSKILVFVDDGVVSKNNHIVPAIDSWIEQNKKHIKRMAPVQVVPGGEKIKNNPDFINKLIKQFNKYHMCRHSYVVIIGGGAVLDAVGFAASIAHRGLRQIRIPTTVLAQNDSGVGVKNGINSFGIKNYIGTFSPPWAVINDSLFLETLSYRDWISGLAEAFKVGITKDKSFVTYLNSHTEHLRTRNLPVMEEVIRRCALLHVEHTKGSNDPFEGNSFRPLDFGHWSAHRLESLSRSRLRHGEAVAIGIALDLFCAQQLGLVTDSDRAMVIQAMRDCDLPVWDRLLFEKNTSGELVILKGLQDFREHMGGELTLIMPSGLGQMTEINALPESIIKRAIKELKKMFREYEVASR